MTLACLHNFGKCLKLSSLTVFCVKGQNVPRQVFDVIFSSLVPLGKKHGVWCLESSLEVLECEYFQHRGSRKNTDDITYKFPILLCRMHFKAN